MLRYTEQVVNHVQENTISNDLICINKPRAAAASSLLAEWDNLSSDGHLVKGKLLLIGCVYFYG